MSTQVTRSLTVLIVDDSVVIHELVRRALEADYQVLVAHNAIDALSTIHTTTIDLVLLDVMMPGISGLEFCRTVRNLPQFKDLPVVIVTSKDSAFDRVQGRLAGASDYLTKPFNPEQLQAMVSQWITTRSSSGS